MNGRGRSYRAVGVVALMVVLGAVLSTGDWALGAYSGANGKIAFETTRDGNSEIYVMEPDGSGQTNITNDPAADTDPVWSPDGTRIAFVKASEGHRNIYVMNADGSGQTNLTPGPETSGQANGGTNPTWSPDGSRIAYDHGGGDIWVMNADGSGKTNLTNTPPATAIESQPTWSPDGTRIAYVRDADIWVMNADGTGQTQLTSTTGPGQDEKAPDWSPDGTRIVYGKGSSIWVMNADGSGQTQLAANSVLPSWSPDGTKIVFSSSSFGAPNGPDIFVMNPDGTGITRLPTAVPAADTNPTWQPVAASPITTTSTTTSTTTTSTTTSTTSSTTTSTTTSTTVPTTTTSVPTVTTTSTSTTSTSTTTTSTSTTSTTVPFPITTVPGSDTDPDPTPPDPAPPDTVPADTVPPDTVPATTTPPTTAPPTTVPPTTAVPSTAPLALAPEPEPEPEPEDASPPATGPTETLPADSAATATEEDVPAPTPTPPGTTQFVPFQAASPPPPTSPATVPSPTSTTPGTGGTQTEAAAPAPPPDPTQVQQAATLEAVSSDGVASGPPGVGLQVTGTEYPADCSTVFFFFDGTRIGSAEPDDGVVRKMTLSVPGGADEGRHLVTSSCRSSGDPVLSSSEFEVTEASLHRSAFATSLPRTDHVSFDLGRVLLSALAVLGLLLLIAFPAELFNSTLEEHYDEVRGWLGLGPRRPGAGTGVSNVAVFTLFVLLSGPLCFAMLSSSALDLSTAVAALGLSLATGVVVLASDAPTFAHLRRRYGETASVVALPGSLIVTVACVLLSRAVNFEPGYFYGLVGGLAFGRQLRRDTAGRLASSSALALLVLSIAAWVLLGPVSEVADRPGAGLLPIFAESVLGGVFWVALDSLVIALLPLRLLTGHDIARWSRRAWVLLYGGALFAFVHILLRPSTGYVADTSRSPTLVVVGLFVAFGVISFAFWAYFQYRSPRTTEPAQARVE